MHHGGAGTTQTGLEAGKPTFAVPQFFDQPYWGKLIYELGCGPPPVRIKKLTPQILATALDDLSIDAVVRDGRRSDRREDAARGRDQSGRGRDRGDDRGLSRAGPRRRRCSICWEPPRDELRRQQHLRQDAARRDPEHQGVRGRDDARHDGHLSAVARAHAGDPEGGLAQSARRRSRGAFGSGRGICRGWRGP